MFQSLINDGLHMAVGQGVEDGFPLPARLDQTHVFQRPQLVGYGGLAQPQQRGNIAYAQFRGGEGV